MSVAVLLRTINEPWFLSFLSEWVPIKAFVRLESALCSQNFRKQYLESLQQTGAVINNSISDTQGTNPLRWALNNGVCLSTVRIETSNLQVGSDYLLRFGKSVRSAIVPYDTRIMFFVKNYCVNLTEIEYSSGQYILNDCGLVKPLIACTKLTKLTARLVRGSFIDDMVQACPNLRALNLGLRFQTRDFEYWQMLTKLCFLETLWLPGLSVSVTNSAQELAQVLSGLPHLCELSVSGMHNLGLQLISKSCPNLRVLKCDFTEELRSASLLDIADHCPNLSNLSVGFCGEYYWCDDDFDESEFLTFLRRTRRLERAWFGRTYILTSLLARPSVSMDVLSAARKVSVPLNGISVMELHVPSLSEVVVAELVACSPRLRAFGHIAPTLRAMIASLAASPVIAVVLHVGAIAAQDLGTFKGLQHVTLSCVNYRQGAPEAVLQLAKNSPQLKTLWVGFRHDRHPDQNILLKIARACPLLHSVKYKCLALGEWSWND